MSAKLKLILIVLTVPILSVVLVTAHARLRDAGPVKGKVIEAGTGRSIQGAFVVVKWTYYLWHTYCFHVQVAQTDADGEFRIPRQIRHVALSGKPNVGHFVVAVYKKGYRDIRSSGMLISVDSAFVVYRPPDPAITSITIEQLGLDQEKYEYRASYAEEQRGIRTKTALRSPLPAWWKFGSDWQYLVPDTSTPKERLKHLEDLSRWTSCYGAGQQNRNLVPFQEALYDEARAIATNATERKIARSLCEDLAYVATREDGHPSGSETDTLKAAYLRAHRPECLSGTLAPEPPGDWVRGDIHGRAFRPDRVKLKHGRLAFSQSKGEASDIVLEIPLLGMPGGKTTGRVFHVGENDAASPTLSLRWTDPATGHPKSEFIREGYTLDLEFGQQRDYEIPGKVSLHIPPYGYLSGVFTASTSDLRIVDGEVDLTQDNLDTLYYVAKQLIQETYRAEEVEIQRRSSTLSATGRGFDANDRERIYAVGELTFTYRVGGGAAQKAEFQLVRDRNGWRVERVVKPANFPELQKRENR
jgi:hypothetical protein